MFNKIQMQMYTFILHIENGPALSSKDKITGTIKKIKDRELYE